MGYYETGEKPFNSLEESLAFRVCCTGCDETLSGWVENEDESEAMRQITEAGWRRVGERFFCKKCKATAEGDAA